MTKIYTMKENMKKLLKKIEIIGNPDTLFIVGGWVRDFYLDRHNRDLDLAISKKPLEFSRKVAKELSGRLVILDETNKIYRVVLKNNPVLDYIDIAHFKGPDIIADLHLRDFTINSLALPLRFPLTKENIIDPAGARPHIKKGIVSATYPGAFIDDPVRLLRVFRFASEYGFTIDHKTNSLIKKHARLIIKSSPERIRDEFFRILNAQNAAFWINELDSAGVLDKILPEISRMKKSARAFYYHPKGLWQHSLETLSGLEEIIEKRHQLFAHTAAKITEHLSEYVSSSITRLNLLKFIALMHDAAKPMCAKKIGGRMRFIGHETKGSALVAVLLRRLHASKNEIKIAQQVIEHHMRPTNLGSSKIITDRAVYRLLRDIGDNLIDLLLLTLGDCYSYRKLKTKKAVELRKLEKIVQSLITRYFEEKEKPIRKKLVDGHDLMKHFNLQPGPIVGHLLRAVLEAQMLGSIKNTDEAISLARHHLTRLKKRYRIKNKQ